MRVTPPSDLDRAVAAVADQKSRWPDVPIPDRVDLLRGCIAGCVAVADDMAIAGCRAKGLDPNSPAGAEEWMSGPLPVVRNLRLLVETLSEIERTGRPRAAALKGGHDTPEAPPPASGDCRVRVFPRNRFERLLYPDVTIDVWLDSPEPTFVPRDPNGAVALVLGAGNVASIGLMDLLYKLFVENHVVILKMHPINDYLGPHVERAFAPLIDAGYLCVVYGDAEVGQRLVAHPSVDEIHLTGSAAVHDRIASATTKPITSELGCVTPVIVTPGEWSDAELAYQAENVATMVAINASCNCNAAKLIVTWHEWPQRRAFLDRVSNILSSLPPRLAYYPGSCEKYTRFLEGRGASARVAPTEEPAMLSFVSLYGIDPRQHQDPVFNEEAWSPIVAETALLTADEGAFLDDAVELCNDHVAGTLSAVVLVDPRARARLGATFDRAIADLRYGTVAINHWSAMSYVLAVAPWGAYPGHTREAVGSGIGVVHNTLMLDDVIKSVLDGPFTTRPKPAWFVTHRRAHIVARRMVPFEAAPSWWRLPALALAAYRS
jgi:acyl-CoA reductase-like NAD-dependent aldehyde dehydrogenase